MKKYQWLISLITVLTLGLISVTGYTGNSCQQKNDPKLFIRASHQGIALQNDLNHTSTKVALIARVGSNLSKYGLHYSHLAFAVRDYPGYKGRWTVVHLLNQCNTNQSSIYAQGLMNFFMDDLYNMDYQVVQIAPDLQNKILGVLNSPLRKKLHDSNYSMISYPFSTQYQNSNQWILEVIAAALSNSKNRQQAQTYLEKSNYKPTVIHIGDFDRIGANMFKANVRFNDHPREEQRSNHYSVVSVDSILSYLKSLGKITASKEGRE